MNSNSQSPIYLCARRDSEGYVTIVSIGLYQKHLCYGQIDLKFDKDMNYIPYSEDPHSSHFHRFNYDEGSNKVNRTPHDKNNVFPIGEEYTELIQRIVEFNKAKKR